MARCVVTALVIGCFPFISGTLLAADGAATQAATSPSGPSAAVSPSQAKALDRGLSWLADHQGRDGAWSAPSGKVGITSLATLAFMASGSTPDQGAFSKNISAAVTYLLSCANEDGYFTGAGCSMYDHAFAMLALSQAHALAKDKLLREKIGKKLVSAVALTQQAQGASGGWRYQPKPGDADVVATCCQILSLRAARTAGLEVNQKVIDKGRQYIHSCQTTDGSFVYISGPGAGNWVRTCVAVAVLGYVGPVDGRSYEKAMASLRETRELPKDGWPLMGSFFMRLALSQAGGEDWDFLSGSFADSIIQRQQAGGEWTGEGDSQGATAFALLMLQYPKGHLDVLAWKPLPEWEKDAAAPGDGMAALWEDLAADDPAKAYRAQAAMVVGGKRTVAFLREKLGKAPVTDEARVAKLIADLDADDYKTRDGASEELLRLGSRVEASLEAAAKGSASAEVRTRASAMLAKLLESGDLPKKRQTARAIRVLGRIGGPEAAAILESLAKSGLTLTETHVAKSTLASMPKPGSAPAP